MGDMVWSFHCLGWQWEGDDLGQEEEEEWRNSERRK